MRKSEILIKYDIIHVSLAERNGILTYVKGIA